MALYKIKCQFAIAIASFAMSVFLASCATTEDSTVYLTPITVTPITRWVSPIYNDANSQRFKDFLETVNSGNPKYDSKFRETGSAKGAAIVDCRNVEYLGIVIVVDKSRLNRYALRSNLVLRFRWQHTSIDTSKSKYNYIRDQANIASSGNKGDAVFVAGLRLSHDREFTDGLYTVDVSYKGILVYQDSFKLVDCGKSYAPEWYE